MEVISQQDPLTLSRVGHKKPVNQSESVKMPTPIQGCSMTWQMSDTAFKIQVVTKLQHTFKNINLNCALQITAKYMHAEDYVIQDDFTSSEKFNHDVSETSCETSCAPCET